MFEDSTFLYVEDDAPSRQVMNLVMKRIMQVPHLVTFPDSTDFMARLKALEPPPTIFLLDVHVEPHDGFSMLQMIRQEPQFADAKIIALTASVMNEEVAQLRVGGFDGAISKPLNVSVFPELIRQVVAGEAVWFIQ